MTAVPTFTRNAHPMRSAMPLLPMDAEQARFWALRRERSPRAASPVSPAGARPSPISAVEAGADKGGEAQ